MSIEFAPRSVNIARWASLVDHGDDDAGRCIDSFERGIEPRLAQRLLEELGREVIAARPDERSRGVPSGAARLGHIRRGSTAAQSHA